MSKPPQKRIVRRQFLTGAATLVPPVGDSVFADLWDDYLEHA